MGETALKPAAGRSMLATVQLTLVTTTLGMLLWLAGSHQTTSAAWRPHAGPLTTASAPAPTPAPAPAVPALQTAYSSSCNMSLAAQDTRQRLLVVVIAGGNRSVYGLLRGFWRLISTQVAPLGVHIYLVRLDPTLTTPSLQLRGADRTLLLPGNDSLVPGVLQETVQAMQYIQQHRLPGYKAPFVLRTNLSSFWAFHGLLAWLQGKPQRGFVAGKVGTENKNGTQLAFPSGAGYVLSRDVWAWLLQHQGDLDYGVIDDVAVGQLLAARGLAITPMSRQDFTQPLPASGLPATFPCNSFHWRVKSRDSKKQAGGGGALQDAAVFSSLYFFWYGPRTDMAP